MMQFAIYDLDGVIADLHDRIHYLQRSRPDYDAFNREGGHAPPIPAVIRLMRALMEDGIYTVIATAREDRWREMTVHWLRQHNVPYHLLLMRKREDKRSSLAVKEEWLRAYLPEDVLFIMEDRDNLVAVACAWLHRPATVQRTLLMPMHPKIAIITGASSGLGKLTALLLAADGWTIFNYSLTPPEDQASMEARGVHYVRCDITSPDDVYQAAQQMDDLGISVLINNAGINEINWLPHVSVEMWDDVMNTNARAIMLMSQVFLDKLTQSKGTILNIISNAAHIPMTASIAYNASKAAAHIMTLQMARELTKQRGITVFGIAPNKLAGTGMSHYIEQRVTEVRGWTPEYAAQYQTAALVTGEETEPVMIADLITYLLGEKKRHKYLSGCILPYGA